MRKISANYIFTGDKGFLNKGIVSLSDENIITEIIDTEGKISESENLEFYNGIICPGFINAHCHIELSHMKGSIEENSGMIKFIEGIIAKRHADKSVILNQIEKAERLMISEGIKAVGDICNTDYSISQKAKHNIFYHSFIELFDYRKEKAQSEIKKGLELKNKFNNSNLKSDIAPHAPHTVNQELFKLIKDYCEHKESIFTFHNQESQSENNFFSDNTGELFTFLTKLRSNEKDGINMTGKSSLMSISDFIPMSANILPVHNVYTSESDIEHMTNKFNKLFWVLCPASNKFIENKLPDLPLFIKKNQTVVVGTDSLASNKTLSILEELKLFQKKYTEVSLEFLLKAATFNGARALAIDSELGSIEIGKKPGLNLIKNADLVNLKLTEQSIVNVLA